MAIDIGRIAYQAYTESMLNQMPRICTLKWEDIGKIEQDAWRHAAVAVLQYIDKERKQLELDKEEDEAGFEI